MPISHWPTIFSHLKPAKPPRPAVTARVCRNLAELTKDNVAPTPILRAEYERYVAIKRRQRSAA